MEVSVKYLYAVAGWVLWCTLHSALISITMTEYAKRKLGDRFRFYRIFYNFFSLVTLVPLVSYSVSVRGQPVFRWEGSLVIVRYLLVAVSLFLFIAGGRHYSLFEFLGIRQLRNKQLSHTLSGPDTFVASGIHKVIRHPWYLGGIIIFWTGTGNLSLSMILDNLVITSYFIVGTILEERKLVREFGESYREYQKQVSMLLPYKWLKASIRRAAQTSKL